MQIGDTVYLDMKIKNSNLENFITNENLHDFVLVETAGTSLPYLCFSFHSTNKKITEYFIENNSKEIEVSLGNSPEVSNKFTVQLIKTPKNTDSSDATATISAAGFIGSNSYMADRGECRAYHGNSLMVIQKVLKRFKDLNGTVDSDFTKVNENQIVHRQFYETANLFLVRTLLHMNVYPSFPLFSFDKYGQLHIRDYNKIIKDGPKVTFTPFEPDKGQIRYLNNFNVDSYKTSYNLYSGYNKITEILGIETGVPAFAIADNIPLASSSQVSETSKAGNRISFNKPQSANVHSKYEEAYAFNTNRLFSLSSMQGVLLIAGYHPELKPTDLVYVETPKENGMISAVEGNYIIDTIVTKYEFDEKLIKTYVYVTRDNNNNIENFVVNKEDKNSIKIDRKFLNDLANAVAITRTYLATCSQAFDGTLIERTRAYLTAAKNNLLRSFSVDGILMDFTSQARMIQSLLLVGNNLMNVFMELLFPSEIYNLVKDFFINETSVRGIIGNAIVEYVPPALRDMVSNLVDSLCDVHDSINSIAKQNNITVKEIPTVTQNNIIESSVDESEEKVLDIVKQFEYNTTGLDVPFPIITLTESQKLLPENDLEEYIATETIANLTDLGYLTELTEEEVEEFKEVLLGKREIDFGLIDKINKAAGEKFYYRFWGTFGSTNEPLYAWVHEDKVVYTKTLNITEYVRFFNEDYSPYVGNDFKVAKNSAGLYEVYYVTEDKELLPVERDEKKDINSNMLAQLTSYSINKGYKDKFRTLPCTKLISATKNSRLYFACPEKETGIKFYINSKREELESYPIDLGYKDIYGNKLMYTLYYTKVGYNSNSVMLEIRQ